MREEEIERGMESTNDVLAPGVGGGEAGEVRGHEQAFGGDSEHPGPPCPRGDVPVAGDRAGVITRLIPLVGGTVIVASGVKPDLPHHREHFRVWQKPEANVEEARAEVQEGDPAKTAKGACEAVVICGLLETSTMRERKLNEGAVSEIEQQDISWLWVAYGHIHLLEGSK
jgi:hypothetical protein